MAISYLLSLVNPNVVNPQVVWPVRGLVRRGAEGAVVDVQVHLLVGPLIRPVAERVHAQFVDQLAVQEPPGL